MTGRGLLGLLVAVALVPMAGGMAGAQAVADAAGPAEEPPASFTAPQYIDSKGCAFVRAGLGGAATWVPRVTQDRTPMCGLQPSLGAVAAPLPATPAPAVAPGPAEVAAQPAEAAQTGTAVSAAKAPAKSRPAAARKVKARAPAAMPATVTVITGPAVTLLRAVTVPGAQTTCPNAPATAERYVLSDGRRLIRCGPPVRDPVAYLNGLGRPGLRVVAAEGHGTRPPKGYVPVWSDDRLNPARGPQTAEGDAAMASAYEAGVPMRLKPGTALKVPYSGSDGAFVQAGAFANPANADRAMARLTAAGLPVARATGMLGGRAVAFVLAGPVDRSQAAATLAAVRSAGFSDAYLR